jgi:hypothetical protein
MELPDSLNALSMETARSLQAAPVGSFCPVLFTNWDQADYSARNVRSAGAG